MGTLVLLRHGESIWNAEDRFAGWIDIPLTANGRGQACRAGVALAAAGVLPDTVHTSLLRRAIDTAHLAMSSADRLWICAQRSWRLNERHYGALQGRRRSEILATYGAQRFASWRRSYADVPPPLDDDAAQAEREDPRYADLPTVPRSESLAQVSERLLPYFHDAIGPQLREGRVVCVVSHGNSLRALRMTLDGLDGDSLADLEIPTGRPLVYRLDDGFRPTEPPRYLHE